MGQSVSVRLETPRDRDTINKIQREAFGGDPVIGELIARLRSLEAPLPMVSLVAEGPKGMIGHVHLSDCDGKDASIRHP